MIEILQPDGWAKPIGYANGMAARGKQRSEEQIGRAHV